MSDQTTPETIPDDAEWATEDMEADLAELYRLAAILRQDPAIKRAYEELRNRLSKDIKRIGSRLFVDEQGHKHLAYLKAPENTVVDIDELLEMVDRKEIREAALELIAPRKQNLDGLTRAVARGWITDAQLAKITSFKPGTAYVAYLDPESGG